MFYTAMLLHFAYLKNQDFVGHWVILRHCGLTVKVFRSWRRRLGRLSNV